MDIKVNQNKKIIQELETLANSIENNEMVFPIEKEEESKYLAQIDSLIKLLQTENEYILFREGEG